MFTVSVEQQFLVFLYLTAAGMAMGLFFDFFKAGSKVFNFSRKSIFVLDLFICLSAALIVFQALFLTNEGEVRFYVFLALFFGIIFYYIFLSRNLYQLFLKLFKTIKKIIIKMLRIKAALQDYLYKKRINSTESHNARNYLRKEERHGR